MPTRRATSALALLTLLASLLALTPAAAQGPSVFITELHYDNDGTDVGEFVEVAGPAGTDLTGWSIVLYNGNGGAVYDTSALPPAPAGTADGYDRYVVDYPSNGIQNGAPDGIALVAADGSVVELLSYEGTLTAVGGPADGMTSTDIGVAESSSTPVGQSLQRQGPTSATWSAPAPETPGAPNATAEPPPTPACDAAPEDLTLVSAVQGPGGTSPFVGTPVYAAGQTVTVEAVVTVADADLGGFFIQEEPGDDDGDPLTSEGIFVHDGGAFGDQLIPGQVVQVTGAVTESFSRTQLGAGAFAVTDVAACTDGAAVTIAPVDLPLPSDDQTREAFEGMLVRATDLVVSGTYDDYRHGELVTGHQAELPIPSDEADPGPGAAAVEAENDARELRLDDRSTDTVYGRSTWGQVDSRRLGDVVDATGVLDYSFDNWKLQHDVLPTFSERGLDPLPQLEGGNDVVGFNVLNYFNTFGNSATLRGARSQEQFDIQSAKIVSAIVAMDAAVVGLVEIENDYEDEYDGNPSTVPSAQTLVDELNEVAGADTYDWIRVPETLLTDEGLGGGGLGTDAIAVGFIYQPDRATPVGEAATVDIDRDLHGEPTEDDSAPTSKNRWPLAQTFAVDGEVFTAVVNHFKSKGSSCAATGSDGTPAFDVGADDGDPHAGNCDLTRQYAANELVEWLATDPTGSGDDDVLLLGDYNSYAEEAPIDIIEAAGYADLVELQDDDAFTYVFSGRVGRLDYAFASWSLLPEVIDTEVWQINSRAQYTDVYFRDPIDLTGPEGSSDHDPVIVALSPAATTADAGGPYVTTVNEPVQLDASASTDGVGAGLTYAWDLDEDGAFDDATGATPVIERPGGPPGIRTIAVQVTDELGRTSVASTTLEVRSNGQGNGGQPPGRYDRG